MEVKQFNVRISESLIKDVKRFALEKELNVNTLVARALEFYLMCQTTEEDNLNLEKINNELQYYLLNKSMKIILEEGMTELKKIGLEAFKDSILLK